MQDQIPEWLFYLFVVVVGVALSIVVVEALGFVDGWIGLAAKALAS